MLCTHTSGRFYAYVGAAPRIRWGNGRINWGGLRIKWGKNSHNPLSQNVKTEPLGFAFRVYVYSLFTG